MSQAGTPTITPLNGPLNSSSFQLQEWLHLVRRLQEPDELFRLLCRVWIFEEDILVPTLTQPAMAMDHQLTLVADQLCAILPAWRSLLASLPPVHLLQSCFQALTIQLTLPWQQFQYHLQGSTQGNQPNAPSLVNPQESTERDGLEGRARFMLFTLKLLHLQHLARTMPHYEIVSCLQVHLPSGGSFVRQVRLLSRVQQICIQTATQPEILLMWRQGLLARLNPQDKEVFLRQCLLDVPQDEQDLFLYLVPILQLNQEHILRLQIALSHAQDYQIQLLVLLLRKPLDVVADVFHFLVDPPVTTAVASQTPSHHSAQQSTQSVVQSPSVSSTSLGPSSPPVASPSSSRVAPTASSVRSHFPPISAILQIVRQPPKETIKDKILNPVPGIRVDGLRDEEQDVFVVKASLIKTSDSSLIDDGLQGCTVHQVSASRLVNFKKLKIKHTCKQLNCNQVSIRFQLMRQTENGSFEPTGVEITGIAMEVFSHTSQLHGNIREEGTPVISGILPDHGPATGGGTAALLGCDLLPSPEFVVSFGGQLLRPTHAEVGWVLIEIPPYRAHIGSPVYITISMDGGTTFCETGCNYSYENV